MTLILGCKNSNFIDNYLVEKAVINGNLAQESFKRSLNFTNAWLELRDPESGLIPANLNKKIDLWEPENSAADNYPFMVLTAYLLDKDLYNRRQDSELKAWIDSEIKVLFGIQKDSGIIEGWHGDGNFARTALIYGLWKTQGAHLEPWQPTGKIGAIFTKDKRYFVITAENDWEGQLIFDQKRYKTILNLPVDYPLESINFQNGLH